MSGKISDELGMDRDDATFATLPETHAVELLASIRATRGRHREALDQAIDAALAHVPRLLRGALRKVLF